MVFPLKHPEIIPQKTKIFTKLPLFLSEGLPKGGVGSDIWEKFPNDPVTFFCGRAKPIPRDVPGNTTLWANWN